jgi:drug/metabolite transporter (DMT)-like permease
MSLNPHTKAILQALLVTFLWSTSVILIKIGLLGIPPIMFAAFRYGIAFLILLPIVLGSAKARHQMASLDRRAWLLLTLLGLVFYTLTQGAQFLSLVYLPAVTQSLLLNFTVIVTALLGIAFLSEKPRKTQWIGMGVFLLGTLVYFYPLQLPLGFLIGIGFGAVQVLSNALSSILGRYVNRDRSFLPLVVTTISMGAGALVLLIAGFLIETMPTLTVQNWAVIIWPDAFSCRVKHNQQYHVDPDRCPGMDLSWRIDHRPGVDWHGTSIRWCSAGSDSHLPAINKARKPEPANTGFFRSLVLNFSQDLQNPVNRFSLVMIHMRSSEIAWLDCQVTSVHSNRKSKSKPDVQFQLMVALS